MFEDSGSKLRRLAKVFFWICVVGVIILAFAGAQEITYDRWGDAEYSFSFVNFIGILVAGIIGSYISCLFLSAFGELVESASNNASNNKNYSMQIAENTRQITVLCDKILSSQDSVPSESRAVEPKIVNDSQVYKLLSKAIQFSTDDGCRNLIKYNIDTLSDEEKAMITPIMPYLNSSSSGIKVAVNNLLKSL